MARAPDKRKDEARKLYEIGAALKDIALQLDIPEGTIRSWKNREKWDCNATQKKECNVAKKTQRNAKKNKAVAKEVEAVMSNEDLTDKQRLFCIYYSKTFNATQSYQKAYEVDYISACASGPRLLENVRVREEITKIKEQAYTRALLNEEDIFQKYLEIAYADVTAFSTFGKKEIKYVDKVGKEQTATVSYVDLKESTEVDGTLISEVSQGKDGIKVKLADRMKALQWLSDHKDMATAEQRSRIAYLKAQADKLAADDKEQSESVVIVNDIPRPDPC